MQHVTVSQCWYLDYTILEGVYVLHGQIVLLYAPVIIEKVLHESDNRLFCRSDLRGTKFYAWVMREYIREVES